MSKFSSWDSYYSNRPPAISNLILHWQYLLKSLIIPHQNLLEIGCGPAEHSLFLKQIDPPLKLSLLDQDKALLSRVVDSHPQVAASYHMDILSSKDTKKLPVFDLVISQGLMEHFSDKDFTQVIKNLSGHTQKYLFSVPSDQYKNQDYGNEILRSHQQMRQLLSQIPGIAYTVSPYIDIGLRTKLQHLKARHLTGLSAIKYLLTSSLHLLVEITYK